MTKTELKLEKRHAKWMRDFLIIHKNGSYKAMTKFSYWNGEYLRLKNLLRK